METTPLPIEETLTTDAIFEQLLQKKEIWDRTGRSNKQRLAYQHKLKVGKVISKDTKTKILLEAGQTIRQQAIWVLPPLSKANKS